jgi:hypothetical protein
VSADPDERLRRVEFLKAAIDIAVALRADAPRVEQGTVLYYIDADGQPVYS